jgi:large subunit ribosomal protein L25
VDVSGLEIGDALHVSDVVAPKGVSITTPLDEILCSVLAPKAEEEEPEPEVTEPEVIGEKTDESGE